MELQAVPFQEVCPNIAIFVDQDPAAIQYVPKIEKAENVTLLDKITLWCEHQKRPAAYQWPCSDQFSDSQPMNRNLPGFPETRQGRYHSLCLRRPLSRKDKQK